jgi:hypothetical protein
MDVFRSRRLELYNHPALIADLGRLTIEEKSYGHRLSAVRNASGHADLATALAIALPLAVERAGSPPVIVGRPMFGPGVPDYSPGTHPYASAMADWERRVAAYAEEQEDGRKHMYEDAFIEQQKLYMRLVGRRTS